MFWAIVETGLMTAAIIATFVLGYRAGYIARRREQAQRAHEEARERWTRRAS